MIIWIPLLILGIFLTIYGYFSIQKAKQIKFQRTEQIKQKQNQIEKKQLQLKNLDQQIRNSHYSINRNKEQLDLLHQQQEKLNSQIDQKEKDIKKYYDAISNNATEAFNKYEEGLDTCYAEAEKKFNSQIKELEDMRASVQAELDQLKSTYQAAAAAQIREKEKEDEWRFYSIHLSDNEASDIAKLQKWKTDLFDPSIVSKIIWSTYIIKPTGDLCNRVLGSDKVCGIYKLTNKTTGKVYIGQSVNVSERFRQHIKCGLGVDTPPASATKLYKAMQGSSLWYWTFELIEKCPSSKLNEREKYWIDFYQSDKIGYNSQKGNK